MTLVLSEFGFIFQEVASNIIVYCLFSIFFQMAIRALYSSLNSDVNLFFKKPLVFKNSLIFYSTCPFLTLCGTYLCIHI